MFDKKYQKKDRVFEAIIALGSLILVYVLYLLLKIVVINGMDYFKQVGLNDRQISQVISITSIIYAVMQPVVGLLMDRFGIRRVVLFSVFCMIISGVLMYFAHSYYQILIARIFLGFGSAPSFVGMPMFLSKVFGPQYIDKYLGLLCLLGHSLFFVANMLIADNIETLTFGGAIKILCFFSFIVMAIVYFKLKINPLPELPHPENSLPTKDSFIKHFKTVFSHGGLWLLGLLGGGLYANIVIWQESYGVWFLTKIKGVSVLQANALAVTMFAACSVICTFIAVITKYINRFFLLMFATLSSVIMHLFLINNFANYKILIIGVGFCAGFEILVFGAAVKMVKPKNVGLANGFLNCLICFFGAIIQNCMGYYDVVNLSQENLMIISLIFFNFLGLLSAIVLFKKLPL